MEIDKLKISNRLRNLKLKKVADEYRNEVRIRLAGERGGNRRDRAATNHESWEIMWTLFEPAVIYLEKYRVPMPEEAVALTGLPDRTTNDILDPNYSETDPGKQLRDGLIWVALEFDRVVEDAKTGPIVHLEDASKPPPNAFAINILRTYALANNEKRRDLIGRALSFAEKSHDPQKPENKQGGFLHEIDGKLVPIIT